MVALYMVIPSFRNYYLNQKHRRLINSNDKKLLKLQYFLIYVIKRLNIDKNQNKNK